MTAHSRRRPSGPRLAFSLLVLLFAGTVLAAELPPDVLLKSRWIELTKADYQTALSRIPPEKRFQFGMSVRRIESLLTNVMVERTLAAHARMHGVKLDASSAKTPAEVDRELARAELQRVETEAAAAFDRDIASFEVKAREMYKLGADKYRTPDEVRLSDISVVLRGRSEEAARQRAAEARAKILAGADFAEVAREYSDDPATKEKGGALGFIDPTKLHPTMAKTIASLKQVGDVSEPVRLSAAFHVLRLEERRPGRPQTYEEVREKILDELRKRYIGDQRELIMQSIHNDPSLQVNRPAIESLVNRVDPELFKVKPPPAAAPAAQ